MYYAVCQTSIFALNHKDLTDLMDMSLKLQFSVLVFGLGPFLALLTTTNIYKMHENKINYIINSLECYLRNGSKNIVLKESINFSFYN